MATEAKTPTISRRVQRGHGVTGLAVELSLIHMFHLSLLRGEGKQFLAEVKEGRGKLPQAEFIVSEMMKILEYFCQEDFKHPMDPTIWDLPKADNEL